MPLSECEDLAARGHIPEAAGKAHLAAVFHQAAGAAEACLRLQLLHKGYLALQAFARVGGRICAQDGDFGCLELPAVLLVVLPDAGGLDDAADLRVCKRSNDLADLSAVVFAGEDDRVAVLTAEDQFVKGHHYGLSWGGWVVHGGLGIS